MIKLSILFGIIFFSTILSTSGSSTISIIGQQHSLIDPSTSEEEIVNTQAPAEINSYFGGSFEDYGNDLIKDNEGNYLVVGRTGSIDL